LKVHHVLEPPAAGRPIALAVGFFDGLHRGHRAIVRETIARRRPGAIAAALTFPRHPATLVRPGSVPPLIATLEERVNLLAGCGLDELYLVPFDAAFAEREARAFLLESLVGTLGVETLVIGENFRFGRGRTGDVALARSVLEPLGAAVVAVPPLLDDGERVSSTRVRAALLSGDLTTANRLLGAPYALRGRVSLGFGRGHDLGFPTANLEVPAEKTLPADGVYAAVGRYDGRDRRALVSIGTNPTFAGTRRTVEVWLLDFDGTIYGEELALRDFAFVRGQLTFASVDELVAQMARDAEHARFPSFATATASRAESAAMAAASAS